MYQPRQILIKNKMIPLKEFLMVYSALEPVINIPICSSLLPRTDKIEWEDASILIGLLNKSIVRSRHFYLISSHFASMGGAFQ